MRHFLYPCFLLCLLVCSTSVHAQTCCDKLRTAGIASYNKGNYADAIKKWEAAKACATKCKTDDLKNWIKKANNKVAIQKKAQEDQLKKKELEHQKVAAEERKEREAELLRKQQERADEDAWEFARDIDSKAAYEKYLNKYPKGKYAEQARAKIKELRQFTPAELKDFLDAATNGDVAILKKYLDLGLKTDVTLNSDNTALVNALYANKPEAVNILLKNNADPNVKVNGTSSPIIEASYVGFTEIVELLIQYKADVNIRKQDGSGITPLMFACIRGNKEVVQKLIDAGADPNLRSGQNTTALDYANELSSPLKEQIIAILLEPRKKKSKQ